jgi:hypothetical protein
MSRGRMIVHFHWPQHTSSSLSLVRPSRSGSLCEFSQIKLLRTGLGPCGGGGTDGEGKVHPESHVRLGKGKPKSRFKHKIIPPKSLSVSLSISWRFPARISVTARCNTLLTSTVTFSNRATRRSGLSAHRRIRPEVPRQPFNGYVSRFRGIPPCLMASSWRPPPDYIIHVLFLLPIITFLDDDIFFIDRQCTSCSVSCPNRSRSVSSRLC